MIVTDDDTLAERARTLRAHGMSLSDLARHQAQSVVIEEYHDVGYNYRLSDLHAAVGIEQMKRLDFMLAQRKRVAHLYNEAFADLEGVQLPFSSYAMPHSYQSYMVQLRPHATKTREQVMQELLEAGVATRRGVMAIHLEPYYHQRFPQVRLPVTETATRHTLILPNYATMTEAEQAYVIEHLRRALC